MSRMLSEVPSVQLQQFEVRLRMHWARQYLAKGNHQQALAELTSAIELEPHNGDALALRGILRGGLSGLSPPAADQAIQDLTAAMRCDRESAIYHILRALVGLTQQDFGTNGDCGSALARDCGCGIAHATRNIARDAVRQAEPAMVDWIKAIELRELASNIYLARVDAYAGRGEFDRALAGLHAVLQSEPENVDALMLRGAVWLGCDRIAEAIEDFTAAIEIEPECAEIFAWRGMAYRRLGEVTLARADFRKSLGLASREPENGSKPNP